MAPSTAELKTAFKRTNLWRIGYSFNRAMECEAVCICLTRMALNARHKSEAPKQLNLLEAL